MKNNFDKQKQFNIKIEMALNFVIKENIELTKNNLFLLNKINNLEIKIEGG